MTGALHFDGCSHCPSSNRVIATAAVVGVVLRLLQQLQDRLDTMGYTELPVRASSLGPGRPSLDDIDRISRGLGAKKRGVVSSRRMEEHYRE